MSDDAQRSQERWRLQRQRLKEEYSGFYEEVLAILCFHDPIGICSEENPDEYGPEVDTIFPKLKDLYDHNEARQMIHKEFIHWFDENIAGPEERYIQIAIDIWEAWLRYQAGKSRA